MKPTFSGEVQFRRYSDTSSQGQQIVCAVADREALESFIGKEGKRFMAVFVEIGDDELPVEPKAAAKTGPMCMEAVRYCQMPEFADWIAPRSEVWGVEAVKEELCRRCGIESRKELDTDAEAAELFINDIRIPFMKYMKNRAQDRSTQ